MPPWVEYPPRFRRQRGFSLLQLALAIIVLVIVMTLGLQRMLPLRGAAEQTQVLTVIGGLQSALGLETARRILASGDLRSLQGLHGSNPVALLEAPPLNYRSTPPEDGASSGQWYFLPATGELAYRVRYPQYLCSVADGPVTLRWQVEVSTDNHGQPRRVRLAARNPDLWMCKPLHKKSATEGGTTD